MTKTTKSKSKKKEARSKSAREESEFPYLNRKLNIKRRRDYLDNIYYINGVSSTDKTSKELGIRGLNSDEKKWLNQFNKEFYGASFDSDDSLNLHKNKGTDEEIKALRSYISDLKAEARSEAKDNKDPEKLADLYEQIEMNTELLCELYPKKTCTDGNNARNRCLLNKGKATNEVKFIPWESLDQNTIGDLDIDLLLILNDMEESED